jgi:hypothetical protein
MGAHVYVIRFTSDVIKVGWTQQPSQRLKTHAKSARIHGVEVAEHWISKPHAAAAKNEKTLIEFCTSRASSVAGAEYFTGLSYSAVVEFARTLDYKPIMAAERERIKRETKERSGRPLFGEVRPAQQEQSHADAWWWSGDGLKQLEKQLRLSREDIELIEGDDRPHVQEVAFESLKAEYEVADLKAQLREAEARLRQQKDARTKVCNYLYFRLGIC